MTAIKKYCKKFDVQSINRQEISTNRQMMSWLKEKETHQDSMFFHPLERIWLYDLEQHAASLSDEELECWLDQEWF